MAPRKSDAERTALRRHAEQKLKRRKTLVLGNESETQKLVHELQVHQIELELQNEELLRTRQEVERALSRQSELSQRLLAVQEEERRLLAAELHDRTSGNLAALALQLRTLSTQLPPAAGQGPFTIGQIQALLHETADEIRAVCADLRPTLLDHAGIVPALQAYAATFSQRTGIAARVEVTGHEVRPATPVESALFRIAQEALANCAKHARASEVRITLAFADGGIVLDVADNGRGFDPGLREAANLGLSIMRERAEFAGGRLSIDSRPGQGTRIRVSL